MLAFIHSCHWFIKSTNVSLNDHIHINHQFLILFVDFIRISNFVLYFFFFESFAVFIASIVALNSYAERAEYILQAIGGNNYI